VLDIPGKTYDRLLFIIDTVSKQVRNRIWTDSRQDIVLQLKDRLRDDPVLAEWWQTLLSAAVRKKGFRNTRAV
jgi:hypothetical protein